MRRPTWKEEKDKIEEECDLQEEQFISEKQLLGWYNDAIDICESHIHNLDEKWFLSDSPFLLTSGVQSYDLPSDIFGVSISNIQYDDGNEGYDLDRILKLSDIPNENDSVSIDCFSYMIFNQQATGPMIRVYPTPSRDYLNEITIQYIRNANRLDYDAFDRDGQEIDIPEFSAYCRQYVICKVHEKEKQWQNYQVAKEILVSLKTLMLQTLSKKEKDGQSIIVPDMDSYDEYGLE